MDLKNKFRNRIRAENKIFKRSEILLHPNIPKPLHGLSPRVIWGKEWWDKERQKAYQKNNYHCHACGIHKSQAKYHQWLEAHECYKIDYKSGSMELSEIVALCHCCHNYIHDGRLFMLLEEKKITQEKYDFIIEHGEKLTFKLTEDDCPFFANGDEEMADWDKWHLILNGEKHYSKFKSYGDWIDFYSEQGKKK